MATMLGSRTFNGRLKIKHLMLFKDVCQMRTVRRAAEANTMTQPAATKLIQELEHMLGQTLFVRDRSGMTPTYYGQVLLRHANILLADISNLRSEFDLSTHGISGRIRLGVIPSYSSDLLADCIAETLTASPRIQFEIREASTSQLLKELAANELDIAFARPLNASALQDLEVMDIYAESFLIACAVGHPLLRKRRVGWKELAAARWALPAAGTPLRQLLDSVFLRESLPPPFGVIEVSSFEKSQSVIARTDIIGLLPDVMAKAAKARRQLTIIGPALKDFGPISLLRRKLAEPAPAVSLFADIARNASRKSVVSRAK